MCTNELITNTGISIDTVKLSNWKDQFILNHWLSTHSNKFIITILLFIPISKKAIIENIVIIIILKDVISCAPITPVFLPKKPANIETIKGMKIILKYNIIYSLY